MALKFKQGIYSPVNRHKYIGDNIDNIWYRSSWELHAFKKFDLDNRFIQWASEPFAIEYMKPCIRDKKHPTGLKKAKYYPDFYLEYVDRDDKLRELVIEIKPFSQTQKVKGKHGASRQYKEMTLAVNVAKWEAAKKWCAANSLEFVIMTERNLFI